MKIDLCKLLGVEEGEKFKVDGYVDIYFIQNGYIINDSFKRKSCLEINDLVNKEITKLPKKKKFNQNTLNFFKCIDKKYKWIAKDEDDAVYAFCEKPIKKDSYWFNDDGMHYIDRVFNQDIFGQILWEDEESIYIDDYVER